MKISGLVFQTNNIKTHSDTDFQATYKGKRFNISTNHGFGKAKNDFLFRFMIDVVDLKTGMLDVQSYEDHHTIEDAIRSALIGACLYKPATY